MTAVILMIIGFGALRDQKLAAAKLAANEAQEARLRTSQELIEKQYAIDQAVIVGITDVKGNITYANDNFCRISGYTREELLGQNHRMLSTGSHSEAFFRNMYRQIASGQVWRGELCNKAKDSSLYWFDMTIVPQLGPDRKPISYMAFSIDITARKKAEAALVESQERYKLVEAAVNDGLWDWNILTGEAYMSPRWKEIFGFADDELPNVVSSFFDRIHPDDKAAVSEANRAQLEENKPYSLDFRLRCKNGDYSWVNSRGQALRDATGRPIRMLGTTTDINERKRAEKELFYTNERFRMLVSASTDVIWHADVRGNPIGDSPSWRQFTGQSIDDVRAKRWNEAIHPEDRARVEDVVLRGYAEQVPWQVEERLRRIDGEWRHMLVFGVPVRGPDGTVAEWIGSCQDISERKRAEEVLARTNQELEALVAERTTALALEMQRREEAQMTLAQAQKMETVGQLTAGIAHDFNNLLAVIGGGLEFIKGAAVRGLTAEPELIDAAIRSTERGANLVQRLLAFARLAPLQTKPTTVDQLVLDTLRLLQRTLGERIEIVTRLDTRAAVVSLDSNQLVNALLNMALNARDAMPEGGQLIIATTCQPAKWAAEEGSTRWPTGEEVCITISDTGTGMTEETLSHVFEPFFTTKIDGLGSGLGLSMVQGFVEQSGGHIEIDSTVGQGTTITIRLPRIPAASQPSEADAAPSLSLTSKEKTVLLVEDDPDVRIMTAARLKQLGYKVHAVANGMEALDVIMSPADIDITLTDVVLPGGLDGIELVKEAMRARPRMGVLCMSGYDPTQSHRKWLKMQNIDFLEKPFSSARLAQALDNSIAK